MRRKIIIMVSFIILCAFLYVGCDKANTKETSDSNENQQSVIDPGKWKFSGKIARKIDDDGWVYSFEYNYIKDEYKYIEDSEIFIFSGINLRYRYHDDYVQTYTDTVDGKEVTKEVPASMLFLGGSNSEKINRDMCKVAEILDYDKREIKEEDLLKINPDDYSFEELDKELFFGLMNEALNGETHAEGHNILPTYALLNEQTYIDGYEFQVGFLTAIGTVDVIFIDVLYKTGDKYNDYVQLSDMVDNKTATDEQVELYNVLKDIEKEIILNNDLTAGLQEKKEDVISDIKLSRLYAMMKNISDGNYSMYSTMR